MNTAIMGNWFGAKNRGKLYTSPPPSHHGSTGRLPLIIMLII